MTFKPKKNSIIACDLDKTLCTGESFTDEECIAAEPIPKMIEYVNEVLHKKNHCFINIFTARKEYLRTATEYWLKKHGVKYHTLVMEKLWSEVYIDDRAVNITDINI